MRCFSRAPLTALALLAAPLCMPLLSAPAQAGPYDTLQAPPEAVSIPGPVELKLYTGTYGIGISPRVVASFSEAEEGKPADNRLIGLTSGYGTSEMSSGLAEKLGLKVKTKKVNGAPTKYVVVPELWLGDGRELKLEGVVFQVDETPEEQLRDKDTFDEWLFLELGNTGLAWAVRPSAGTVHFAPADQGAALLSAVGGSTVPYTHFDPGKVQFGKRKGWVARRAPVVQGAIGGQSLSLALELAGGTDISNQVDLPADVPVDTHGDTSWYWLPATIGDVSLGDWWARSESRYRLFGPQLFDDAPVTMGSIGARQLSRVDIAVDPGSMQVALAPADAQVRHDPRSWILAQKEAALKSCLEPEEPLDEEQAALPVGERCAAQYADVAVIKQAVGDSDGALEARTTIADALPQDCSNWMEVGELRLERGEVAEAITALSKASQQFHAWWSHDAWERDDMQKDFDQLSDDQKKAAEVSPQPSVCSGVDGMLAVAYLANGDTDAVAQLYNDYLDLDPTLASVYGSVLIMADDVEAAHGPWRMVDHLTLSPSLKAKAGLARLFANQGDWHSANINYRRALEIDDDDGTVSVMWAEDMLAVLGKDDALAEATAWADARPDSLGARLAVARILRLTGTPTDDFAKQADPVFAELVERYPTDSGVQALWVRYLVDTGRTDQAFAALEPALVEDPHAADLWLAAAELHTVRGEPERARQAFKRAVSAGGSHPGFALRVQDADE